MMNLVVRPNRIAIDIRPHDIAIANIEFSYSANINGIGT